MRLNVDTFLAALSTIYCIRSKQRNKFHFPIDILYDSGNKRYTESQIRDMVGAPSLKENELCICGDRIDYCVHSYDHMTQGV